MCCRILPETPDMAMGQNLMTPPLVNLHKAIENGPFVVDLPMKLVIFHSYACLEEGTIFWENGYIHYSAIAIYRMT